MQNLADTSGRFQHGCNAFRGREFEPTRQFELSLAFGLAAESDYHVASIRSRALLMALTYVGRNTDRGSSKL